VGRYLSIIRKEKPAMTAPPAVYSQFGTTLAFAERALTAALRKRLAQRDTLPETWYALQLVSLRGPGVSREEVSRDLDGSRGLDSASGEAVLARVAEEGLIRGDARLELTDAGKALHRSLREHIAGPTAELLGQFELGDIETTVRTLQAVTARAEAE
jgi:DNA-binding MarR family transcriptional regulator